MYATALGEPTSRGLRPVAASPSAAHAVYSSDEDWPGAPPQPPSSFCAFSR